MEHVECVVIGAGVVGLAVARALALTGREVVVLEREGAIGTGISARNSEVIHGGLYYPTGSLKGRLCVTGREALYRYCQDRSLPHRRCGKLIVATDTTQVEALRGLMTRGLANRVVDLAWLEAKAARALEPALSCVAAIHSPSTGIIDAHALMLSLQGDAEAAGAVVALHSPVTGAEMGGSGEARIVLEVGGSQPARLACRQVVNAAGLSAPDLARHFQGLAPEWVPPSYLSKGNYFLLAGRAPFQRLIYPIPEPDALGVHLTLDLAGQARFGPDVEWVEAIDYRVDPNRSADFYGEVRRYWPDLPDGALMPGYAGIRPKIVPRGAPAADFQVQGPTEHGIDGLVNLFGIESPGLTSCLALADLVVDKLRVS
ncbi:MAG: NAD(P)/FAD-dependent oxidoreductase [Alphaproteobacteria bacterium]